MSNITLRATACWAETVGHEVKSFALGAKRCTLHVGMEQCAGVAVQDSVGLNLNQITFAMKEMIFTTTSARVLG